jgi:hypothetical protein
MRQRYSLAVNDSLDGLRHFGCGRSAGVERRALSTDLSRELSLSLDGLDNPDSGTTKVLPTGPMIRTSPPGLRSQRQFEAMPRRSAPVTLLSSLLVGDFCKSQRLSVLFPLDTTTLCSENVTGQE